MDRFLAFTRTEDVFVNVNGGEGQTSEEVLATRARVAALPQVAETSQDPYLFLSPDKAGREVGSMNPIAAADDRAFRTMNRPHLLHGRLARLDRPSEAVIDGLTARLRHLHVGSRVTMWSFSRQQIAAAGSGGFAALPAPEGPAYTFDVVGIIRLPSSVNPPPESAVQDALYEGAGGILLTPAFLQRYAEDLGVAVEEVPGIEGFRVRLRHGLADLPGFERDVRNLVSPGDGQIHTGSDNQAAAIKSRRAMHLGAIALVLFGILAGLAAVLVLGQSLSRQVAADAAENPTLAALGLSRRQLLVVPFVRTIVIALAGATSAVVAAVALSPLTPIGLARQAEIHPGFSVNLAVLAIGFIAIVALVMLRALPAAWRAARTRSDHVEETAARPGPLAAAIASSRLGPAATVGAGMSFERGRGMAFRTTLLGAVVAVAGVVAAVTFGVSLNHLVDTPRQQGWNWDVLVGNPNNQVDPQDPDAILREVGNKLTANRYVGAFSGLALVDRITVDGQRLDIAAVDVRTGSVFPTIVEGRAPAAPDEIVLGKAFLQQLHRRVGEAVTLRADDRSATMRIVGRWLQPTASDLSRSLSGGGGITLAAARPLVPEAPVLLFAVRYRPGVDRQAAFRSLRDDLGRQVLRPFPGGEVGDLARVAFLPYVLAGLLVVLAVGGLGVTLFSSVRRHRRDLAMLKTFGFVRRQVSGTVAWQASILAVAAVVVGIPMGVALGRWAWLAVASNAGSVSPPLVPVVALLIVIPVTLLVANLLAAGPGWTAGRVHPAKTLRTE
jgi:ABC-type lipoprotein release transport system permease subunit